MRQRPLTCPPTIPPPPLVCSLLWNEIGAEGAAALAAILKETNITTLWSAAAPEYPFVSAPLDTSQHLPLHPTPAVSRGTNSVLKEEPLSQRASRATPHCDRWSRLLRARTCSESVHLTFLSTCLAYPRLQSGVQQPRCRRWSRPRCRDQGQFNAAKARVSQLALEPALSVRLSASVR